MNSWERFNETPLPNKEDFYSCLNMEDITDTNYRHAKREFKELKMNNLGDYHDLYVMCKVIRCYLLIYLRILEINYLKNMSLILLIFYQHQD